MKKQERNIKICYSVVLSLCLVASAAAGYGWYTCFGCPSVVEAENDTLSTGNESR